MITINKGSDEYGVEMIVMLIVATADATVAASSVLLLLLLVGSFSINNINKKGGCDDYGIDVIDLATATNFSGPVCC